MKDTYAIQPYQVGQKDCKSLAIVIPAKVAKEYGIDTSSIFLLKTDKQHFSIIPQIHAPRIMVVMRLINKGRS